MKPFSKRAKTSEVSAIKRIASRAKQTRGAISLAQGLPSFSTPKYIRKGVADALLSDEPGIGKYSVYMGMSELRTLLSNRLSKEWKKTVDPDKNIFVSSGGMEGLLSVILALVDRGDEAIVLVPNYGPHFQHLHLSEGKAVYVPLNEKNGWSLDIDAVEKAVTPKSKLMLLTNPGNPLGNVIEKDELKKLARLANKYDLWVLVDETYSYLTYDGIEYISAGTIPEFKDRVIISRTFSKEYAMTGWRLGYVYGPESLIREALKMHDPMVIAASTVSQRAGIIALKGNQQVVADMVEVLKKRCDRFCTLLDELSPYFSYVRPKGAYYIFAHVAKDIMKRLGPTSEAFAFRMLEEAKVAVVPGSEFHPVKDEYIRLCFAGEGSEFEKALKRIKKWLEKQR